MENARTYAISAPTSCTDQVEIFAAQQEITQTFQALLNPTPISSFFTLQSEESTTLRRDKEKDTVISTDDSSVNQMVHNIGEQTTSAMLSELESQQTMLSMDNTSLRPSCCDRRQYQSALTASQIADRITCRTNELINLAAYMRGNNSELSMLTEKLREMRTESLRFDRHLTSLNGKIEERSQINKRLRAKVLALLNATSRTEATLRDGSYR